MKPLPEEIKREREYAELLRLAFQRGFTIETLDKIYLARIHATGQLIPLPEFWRAVHRGDFDYMLKDKTGQSYS
jgi:hypothetical protein